ncbi:MAG: protein kinase [Candidatus Aminicenantales bacterium]
MTGVRCPKCHFKNPSNTRFCSRCSTPLHSEEKVSSTKTLLRTITESATGSTLFGRYKVIEELGRGGMGRVYKVFDKKIEEEIALKLIKPEISADERTIRRFRNELKLARKITHKNVCRMYDLNEVEGTYYITMEYISGVDLKKLILKTGRLSVRKAVSIAKQICEGLAEAHRLGVVHRDLKSKNIMVDKVGNVRIMDFGLARSLEARATTETGAMLGTPHYMSPEQVESKEVDQRSDIYSLGIILFEMVTGRVPFQGESTLSIALKHKTEAPPNPLRFNAQIPEGLSYVILKCLEKNRENRYESAEELLYDLNKIEKGIQVAPRIFPEKYEEETKRKHFNFLVFGILFFSLIIFISGYFLYHLVLVERESKQREKVPFISEKSAKQESITNQFGYLEIDSIPKGAEVYIDNKREGTTPFKGKFLPGKYKLIIRKSPEYKEIQASLDINAGKTFSKNYKLTPVHILKINTIPERADIWIDGNYRGKTPIQLELSKSTCQLSIRKDEGWYPVEEFLELKPGFNLINRSLKRIELSMAESVEVPMKEEMESKEIDWKSWQAEMKFEYQEAEKAEKNPEFSADKKMEIWQEFIDTYKENNPFSNDDEFLRHRAKQKLKFWESYRLKKIPIIRGGKSIFVLMLGTGDSKNGLFKSPRGITLDNEGNVYIVERKNHRIQKFTSDFSFIKSWGSYGSGRNQFNDPCGVAIDDRGYIYVIERNNYRIQKFTANGSYIKKWGSYGSGRGQFNDPSGISIDNRGYIYVTDKNNYRIQKFSLNGDFIRLWGSQGSGDGQFNYPQGIAVDNSGYVYVADTWNHRIQKFTSNGDFTMKFGYKGKRAGMFYLPEGIAIDNKGNLYVTDTGNNRIQKFEMKSNFKDR